MEDKSINPKEIKVLHVCYADTGGGGAIGSVRLHNAMISEGVDSRLLVIRKRTTDPKIIHAPLITRALVSLWEKVTIRVLSLQEPGFHSYRSLNIFPTGLHRVINRLNPDVVQFHWVNKNTIGIHEVKKINAPVVWKLPDMWAFGGTEHYIPDVAEARYIEGYTKSNKASGHGGIDVDRLVWTLKKRFWKKTKFTIVCPSKWLASCAKRSYLFKNHNVKNIPNPIDLSVYSPPENKVLARVSFDLPLDKKLIMFTSIQVDADKRKGYQYLLEALEMFVTTETASEYEIVVFGHAKSDLIELKGMKINYLGYHAVPEVIARAYGAVDTVVLPTEADNLPNVIQEAMACGVPCVSFDVGGLPDMITHKVDGYLAEPQSSQGLVDGLKWIFSQPYENLSKKARISAEATHNVSVRVGQYLEVYKELVF